MGHVSSLRSKLYLRLAPRLVALVLAGLLTLIGLVALGGILRIRNATRHARVSGLQSQAYHELAYEGAIALADEQQYLATPSRSLEASNKAITARLIVNLRQAIRYETNPTRRAALQALTGPFATYRTTVDRMFAAVAHGGDRQAILVFRRSVYPGFVAEASTLDRYAARARQDTTAALDSLTGTEADVLDATAVMLGFGFLLLGTSVTILLVYRRREQQGREEELQRLRDAASTDSLTGLGNFRAFHDWGTAELATASNERPVTLTMLDLNGLKRINDRLGHDHGNEQLRRVAEALRELTPKGARAYRIGGDEFAVLAPEQTAWDAFTLTTRLQQRLDETATCGVSAGVADTDRQISLTDLTRQADLARREAKASHQGALVYTRDLESSQASHRSPNDRNVRTLASALARAVDAKDSYTRSHSQTVSQISAQIAEQLGLAEERVARVRLAGLLHDVGKIGISDSILHKPAALTAEEYEIIKSHTELGRSILSSAELDQEADWVLHHHEHWDGGGYPTGLTGELIPLESRIMAVADAFEAITSDRPYRLASSPAVALEELDRCVGTQFDADCVKALEHVIHRHATGSGAALEPAPLVAAS